MSKESVDNSFGVLCVTLGIVSIVISNFSGLIIGALALIFALKQEKISKNSWSKAGKLLGIIGIIIGLIVSIIWFYLAYQAYLNGVVQ